MKNNMNEMNKVQLIEEALLNNVSGGKSIIYDVCTYNSCYDGGSDSCRSDLCTGSTTLCTGG
jgi:hypothetical protein